MKKILYLLLFLALPFAFAKNLRAQSPVIDVPQIAASLLSFLESLSTAIEQTEKISKGLEQAEKTVGYLKDAYEFMSKVNRHIQNAQQMRMIVEGTYYTIEAAVNSYDVLRRSPNFTHQEVILYMDIYTSLLSSLTNSVNHAMNLLKDNYFNMNDKERLDEKKLTAEEIAAIQAEILATAARINLADQAFRRVETMWRDGIISDPLAYLRFQANPENLYVPMGMQLEAMDHALFGSGTSETGEDGEKYDFGNMSASQERTSSQFERYNKSAYGNIFLLGKMIYYLAVFTFGCIGLVRIFRKVTGGEPAFELFVTWLFAILVALAVVEFIDAFFFGGNVIF